MIRDISDDIAVNLKDRLRDFRYVIRRNRHDSMLDDRPATLRDTPFQNRGFDAPELFLGRAASLVDTALTAAETISLSIISGNPAVHQGTPEVQGLSVYFADGHEGQRIFHRDMYYLTKEILRRNRADNMLIHEAAFTAIHASMKRDSGPLVADALRPSTDEVKIRATATACAALMSEMVKQHPIRFFDTRATVEVTADDQRRKIEIIGFAAICLACGLATAKAADMEGESNLESALLAVEARAERIAKAFDAKASGELSDLFETLITHLP
ncbi:MAG: hypothetical protein ACRECW_18190 [Phyllobacterium sp.]